MNYYKLFIRLNKGHYNDSPKQTILYGIFFTILATVIVPFIIGINLIIRLPIYFFKFIWNFLRQKP